MGLSRACFGVGFGVAALGVAILAMGHSSNTVLGFVLLTLGLALGVVGIATRRIVA